MHKKFAELPAQAIRGRLFGVLPPTENSQWSREAASTFLKMVQAKQLVGKIEKIDQKVGIALYCIPICGIRSIVERTKT